MREARRLLLTYLRPQWPRVALLTLAILGSIGLELVNPQVVRAFIDAAQAGAAIRELLLTASLFLGVALSGQCLSLVVTYLGESLAWMTTNALRTDLVTHCLRLDMSYHKTHTPGELIERVDGDVSEMAGFLSQLVIQLAGSALLVVGVLILLAREDWRIGLAGAVYVTLSLGILWRIQRLAAKAWGAVRQADADLFGFLGERLEGMEDIRANGGAAYVMVRLYALMRGLLDGGRRAQLIGSWPFVLGYSVFMLVVLLTLGAGADLYLRGAITIGTVYLLVSYVNKLYEPLQEIQRRVADLQRAAASVGRVTELLAEQPRLTETPHTRLSQGALGVAFRDVTFIYDDGYASGNGAESVLSEVTFGLSPGRVLGLLGRTGSGKTTLARLLFRLYDPIRGSIAVGGVDLRDVGLSDLRGRVGMVTQDVQVFRASVRDNLTFFDRRVSDARLEEALDQLGMGRWLAQLPRGLNTVLEAGRKGLSAGEAQLLAFARVFLKDPGLVILDEASSRLDPATEQLLERAVTRLLEGRTAIIIAHRLATVERADEILVLDGGRVAEYGVRQKLAADSTSRFAALLRTGLQEVLV